jgi:hypothetical protein
MKEICTNSGFFKIEENSSKNFISKAAENNLFE